MEEKNRKPGTPQQGQGSNRNDQQGTSADRGKDLKQDQQRKVAADKNLETERTEQQEVPDVDKEEQKEQDRNLKRKP